jgi:hypothetical protein
MIDHGWSQAKGPRIVQIIHYRSSIINHSSIPEGFVEHQVVSGLIGVRLHLLDRKSVV